MDQAKALSLGFIGGGQMCEAMLRGLLEGGVVEARNVTISEPYDARRQYLAKTFGPDLKLTDVNTDVLKSDAVILAVKPQVCYAVLSDLVNKARQDAKVLNHRQNDFVFPLLISIVAGKPISRLSGFSSQMGASRVARLMPNTPAMVGESATAYALSENCLPSDEELVRRIVRSLGPVGIKVEENVMDAVTGLSGSGPAFAFMFIEALADAGVHQGLSRDVAMKLAAQTLVGAGKMVLEENKHPGVLKDSVCSPGGTTIEGVLALESGGLRGIVMQAVVAASQRSKELSKL